MARNHAWAGGGPENLQTVDIDAPAKNKKTLSESPVNLVELETRTRDELMDVAKDLSLSGTGSLRKQELVFRILQAKAERDGNYFAGGILELAPDGYGFLRADGDDDWRLARRRRKRRRRSAFRPGYRPGRRGAGP